MMRVDPDDREDINFLVAQPDCGKLQLKTALECAVVPPVQEIQEAFDKNRIWLAITLEV